MHSRQKLPCLPCSSYCFLFQVQKEKDIPNTNKKIVTKVNTNISVSVQDRTTNVKREASADPTSDQNASSGTSSDKVISQYLANATSEIAGPDTRFLFYSFSTWGLSRNTRFGLEGICDSHPSLVETLFLLWKHEDSIVPVLSSLGLLSVPKKPQNLKIEEKECVSDQTWENLS